jgi:hypothetical protein
MLERLRRVCTSAGLEHDFVLAGAIEGSAAARVVQDASMKAVLTKLVTGLRLVPAAELCNAPSAAAESQGPDPAAEWRFEGTFRELEDEGAGKGVLVLGVVQHGDGGVSGRGPASVEGKVRLSPRRSEWLSLSARDSVVVLAKDDSAGLCKA